MNPTLPSSIFALGVEARLSPLTHRTIDGERVAIPPFWYIVVSFAGVDGSGRFAMYSVISGVELDAQADFQEVGRGVKHALLHYPVDGFDITVVNGRAVSRLDAAISNKLRSWRLWIPAADVIPDQVVDARVTGWGVGLETRNRRIYVAPYLACQVVEEQKDGTPAPLVVPARTIAPFDREALLGPNIRMSSFLPELFTTLQGRARVGANALVRCPGRPLYYALEAVFEDTTIKHAFAELAERDKKSSMRR